MSVEPPEEAPARRLAAVEPGPTCEERFQALAEAAVDDPRHHAAELLVEFLELRKLFGHSVDAAEELGRRVGHGDLGQLCQQLAGELRRYLDSGQDVPGAARRRWK
eukprot:6892468-Lingulodinium_polyedra.AAC.1